MASEKKPLQNDEMGEVSSGACYYDIKYMDDRYEPYTDTVISVSCPKCNSHNIWYIPGMLGIRELERYWCHDCSWTFDYIEMDYYGSNGDW